MTTRILLAEDNESLALMLKKFLVAQGHEPLLVDNGTDALRILGEERVDILLLDLKLPGINGVEVLKSIRKEPALNDLPVIVMTGVYRGDQYAGAARRLGVRHYLEKPFTREIFYGALQETVAHIASRRSSPPLLEILISVYNNGKSGLLRAGEASPVYFEKGEPVSFLARGRSDFPAFLGAKGKLGREDQKIFIESGEGRLFLIQSGMLTYEELQEESRLFLMKRLMEELAITEGVSFVEDSAELELPLVHIPVPRIIYDAIKFYPDTFNATRALSAWQGHYPCRTALFYRRANLTIMRKDDIDILVRMDGQKTLAELLSLAPSREDAAGFFHFLQLLGMIRMCDHPEQEAAPDFVLKSLFNRPLEDGTVLDDLVIGFEDVVEEVTVDVLLAVGDDALATPLSAKDIDFEQAVQREYAQIKDKDYYTIFGMTPAKFSFNALKEAYFAKTKEYSPERFMELSGTTATIAQEILSIYADAYNTLSSVVAKERYDEMLNNNNTLGPDGKQDSSLHARIQFQSGKVFLDMGEYENAEKSLQDAYTLDPENWAHAAFLAWALYRNPANSNSRMAQDRARSLLTKSLQIEKNADAFAFRGWMLLDEGRDGLAEGEFMKALKINPKEVNARKGLRIITEKREAEKKGLLRRFFG